MKMDHEEVAKLLATKGFRSVSDVFEAGRTEGGEFRWNFTPKAEEAIREAIEGDPTLYGRLFPGMLS
jgi:hypothetical protein